MLSTAPQLRFNHVTLNSRPSCPRVAIYKHQRKLRLPARASQADAVAEAKPSTEDALNVLRQAIATKQMPAEEVLQAMLTLDKAKLQGEDWASVLGGAASPGHKWRLVFTTGTKEVQAAMKKGEGQKAGSGKYFPATAVQRWDATQSEIENGIYVGHLAALTFKGPYVFEGKRLYFDFDTLKLKILGAKFDIPLKPKIDRSTFKAGKDLPFFIFSYVDDTMCVARGRGGGLAVWARTTPAWELQNGLV